MKLSLYLLALLAVLGTFDTAYYHEWRARLPALGPQARSELRLHAWRDFIYAVLFATLPWMAWQGWFAGVLVLLLLAEIALTLWDFVVEDWIRKPLGGVYPGERILHAIMGIVYGAMLTKLVPVIRDWWHAPSMLAWSPTAAGPLLRWMLLIMAIGVFLSGVRDLYAAAGLPGGAWPWNRARPETRREPVSNFS